MTQYNQKTSEWKEEKAKLEDKLQKLNQQLDNIKGRMNRLSHTNKPRVAEVQRQSARKGSLEANTLESIYELYDEAAVDQEVGRDPSEGFLLEQREYNPQLSGDGQDSVGFQSHSSFRHLTPGPYGMSVITGEQHSMMVEGTAYRVPRFSESNAVPAYQLQQQILRHDSQRKRLMSGDRSQSPVDSSRLPTARKTARPDLQYSPDQKFAITFHEPRATTSSQDVSIDYPAQYPPRDTWAVGDIPLLVQQSVLAETQDPIQVARQKLARARALKAQMQGGEDILTKYTLSRVRMM